MSQVLIKGNPVDLEGVLPKAGDPAPNFSLAAKDFTQISLESLANKKKLLLAVPSLDTPVCAKETQEFSKKIQGREDVVLLAVSADLPFAMKRFCLAESIDNVVVASEFRDASFSRAYGIHIASGNLRGLCARAVFLIDEANVVRYVELCSDITDEPDYDAALKSLSLN